MLQGVDTEGLTANQKKKLKKRLKKEKQKDEDEENPLLQDNTENTDSMSKRTKATYDQLMQMNENEEDLQW